MHKSNEVDDLLRQKRNALTSEVNELRAKLAPLEERWGALRNGVPEAAPGERDQIKAELRALRDQLFPLLMEQGKVAKSLPEGRSMSESAT